MGIQARSRCVVEPSFDDFMCLDDSVLSKQSQTDALAAGIENLVIVVPDSSGAF